MLIRAALDVPLLPCRAGRPPAPACAHFEVEMANGEAQRLNTSWGMKHGQTSNKILSMLLARGKLVESSVSLPVKEMWKTAL